MLRKLEDDWMLPTRNLGKNPEKLCFREIEPDFPFKTS